MKNKSKIAAMVVMALLPFCANAASPLSAFEKFWADDYAHTDVASNDVLTISHGQTDSEQANEGDIRQDDSDKENLGDSGNDRRLNISAAVASPVPEPASYALLVTGMILMGVIGHRRRDKFKL